MDFFHREFILPTLTIIKYNNGEETYLKKILGNNLKFSFIKTHVRFQIFSPQTLFILSNKWLSRGSMAKTFQEVPL